MGASDLCFFINNHLFDYFWLLPTFSLGTLCMRSSLQRLSDSAAVGVTLEQRLEISPSQGKLQVPLHHKDSLQAKDVTSLFQG